ncbi:MAG: hypothetical protein JXA20_18035 [Spirochaetes bacterium]|nr:hypothetical protein [Spirochaetota bacterium]
MERIIDEIIQHRDVYCSDLQDIWNELWDMVKDKEDDPMMKLQQHFDVANRRKNISEMLIYIKELVFFLKK